MNGAENKGDLKFNDQLLKLPVVAKLLAVSERTVRRLVDTGDLVSCKVLGSVRIPFSVVQAYYRKITGGKELRGEI